jgi:hypothetical protein
MKTLMVITLVSVLLGISTSRAAEAEAVVSFNWSANNPTSMTDMTVLSGVSTGIHNSGFRVNVPRFCVLINGSTKNVGANIVRAGQGWYVSSSWREEVDDTCFVATYSRSDQLISAMQFGILYPQNLPPGRIELKIQLTDASGSVTTSDALVIQNNAQQPTFEVDGLNSGDVFANDGDQFSVSTEVTNLYSRYGSETRAHEGIKSWCIGLSDASCLPESAECKGSFGCEVFIDTRELTNGVQKLHISVVDSFDRTTRHPVIEFEVRKSTPVVLKTQSWALDAKWTDKVVGHGISIDTRLGALPIDQSIWIGPSRASQPTKGKRLKAECCTDYVNSQFRLTNLKPSTTYWVKVKLVNSVGATLKTFRIKTRSIPKKPAPKVGSGSGGGSASRGCYVGMNWGYCIGLLGYEPKSIDCSGDNRSSFLNGNWWIIGFSGGYPEISKSSSSCS